MKDVICLEKQKLIDMAISVQKNSYAPYSGITVGAVLLTADNKVFLGCNVENASYGASICAERTAILKAVSEGERNFDTIAITSNLEDFIYPCGICLQVMAEFAPKLKIIITNKSNEIINTTVSDLLPKGFILISD